MKFSFILVILLLLMLVGCSTTDLPSTPESYLDVETMWDQRASLIDQEVLVKAFVVSQTVCTLMACNANNLCCNACGGELGLKLPSNQILALAGSSTTNYQGIYRGKAIGCQGNDCGLDCYPMEPNYEYYIRGILHKRIILNTDYYTLELLDFKAVS